MDIFKKYAVGTHEWNISRGIVMDIHSLKNEKRSHPRRTILAPIDSEHEVEPLIKAGATELYFGYRDRNWKERGSFSSIKVGMYGNLNSFDQIEKSVASAKPHNVPLYFCANMYMADGMCEHALSDIKKAAQLGIEGVVIADLSMIEGVKEIDSSLKIILSSKEPCFNKAQMDFFKLLGVDSIFLSPRNMTVEECIDLLVYAKKVGLEVEMFINDIGCRNITQMCQYRCFGMDKAYKPFFRKLFAIRRRIWQQICKYIPIKVRNPIYGEYVYPFESFAFPCHDAYTVELYTKKNSTWYLEKNLCNLASSAFYPKTYCGLCDLYLFKNYAIRSIKLAGRGTPLAKKIAAVSATKDYLEKIENGIMNDSNFIEYGAAAYEGILGMPCSRKQCYHYKDYKIVAEKSNDENK